jgi:hypothetical protein
MIYTQFNFPRVTRWQARLARVPRWAWVAFFVGAMIPMVLILGVAVIAGLIALCAVLIVGMAVRFVSRLVHRPRRHSGEIVVHSVRVVDP